jgi:hypothetical protein
LNFWLDKETVIGRTIELDADEEMVTETIDSLDTHTDFWDNSRTLLQGFPELRQEEYFSILRGRVFLKTESSLAQILMASVLFEPGIKTKILEFFDQEKSKVKWGRDLHYTTSQKDLSALFDDEDF